MKYPFIIAILLYTILAFFDIAPGGPIAVVVIALLAITALIAGNRPDRPTPKLPKAMKLEDYIKHLTLEDRQWFRAFYCPDELMCMCHEFRDFVSWGSGLCDCGELEDRHAGKANHNCKDYKWIQEMKLLGWYDKVTARYIEDLKPENLPRDGKPAIFAASTTRRV